MDPQEQSREQSAEGLVAWSVVCLALFTIAVYIGYRYDITLWDWLKLLVVPAVIAGGGLWFNRQQQERERESTNQRAQDEALQSYLDQMGQMLLDNDKPLRQAREGDERQIIARARTLTVLPRLDGARKGTVVQFLYEAYLITTTTIRNYAYDDVKENIDNISRKSNVVEIPEWITKNRIVDLRGADLRKAHLRGTTLGRVHLANADLSGADLSGARLSDSLGEGFLREADLSDTDLSGADLSNVILASSSYLPKFAQEGMEEIPIDEEPTEEMKQEIERRADSVKDLTAEEKTSRELKYLATSLKGAIMPNGQKYEDWLKDRDSGKDRENE